MFCVPKFPSHSLLFLVSFPQVNYLTTACYLSRFCFLGEPILKQNNTTQCRTSCHGFFKYSSITPKKKVGNFIVVTHVVCPSFLASSLLGAGDTVLEEKMPLLGGKHCSLMFTLFGSFTTETQQIVFKNSQMIFLQLT